MLTFLMLDKIISALSIFFSINNPGFQKNTCSNWLQVFKFQGPPSGYFIRIWELDLNVMQTINLKPRQGYRQNFSIDRHVAISKFRWSLMYDKHCMLFLSQQ